MRFFLCSIPAALALSALVPGTAPAANPDALEHRTAQLFAQTADIGAALPLAQLDDYRGGADIVCNSSVSNGTVNDTTAVNVSTGWNTITEGAFAHASGLPIVIQNSGANVLIQNSTIVNVQFK